MKVEVLYATGCARCLRQLDGLRAAARQSDPSVEWKELNILGALDYAVELGVLRPPALAIDGELAFPSLPTPSALVDAMRKRLKSAN